MNFSAILKTLPWRRLVQADTAGFDVGDEIVFAPNRATGEAAQHGELASVGEGVGDGGLEETVRGFRAEAGGGEGLIEGFEGAEEARDFIAPGQRLRVIPTLVILDERECPIHQIAHMGQNTFRGSGRRADFEGGEIGRRIGDGAGCPVGEGGQGMSQGGIVAGGVHAAYVRTLQKGRVCRPRRRICPA